MTVVHIVCSCGRKAPDHAWPVEKFHDKKSRVIGFRIICPDCKNNLMVGGKPCIRCGGTGGDHTDTCREFFRRQLGIEAVS